MNDLLEFAIEAHGGLDRWNSFSKLAADLSISGAIWDIKQVPGMLKDKTFEIDTHQQCLSITPFPSVAQRTLFTPQRVWIERLDGTIVDSRGNPKAAYDGHVQETPWDIFHVAYFASEALWTYLTSPFLYSYPGFETEEIEPWHEDGEVWRRLKITFPDSVESHTRTQVTHFGPDGLMRRHDYTVDILGDASGANYVSEYRDFQGIMMPTRRRVYASDDNMQKVPEPLLVALDFGRITLS